MTWKSLILAGLMAAASIEHATAASAGAPNCTGAEELSVLGKTWIIKSADNICGLSEASQLSSPAKVDFSKLMKATPEMKQITDDGIDPKSPEGVRLKNAAADRVAKAAEVVRVDQGHCSVWKKIKHKDGREITDLTDEILEEL